MLFVCVRSESKKIFVGGLPIEATETDFSDYFSKFGEVKVKIAICVEILLGCCLICVVARFVK